MIHEEDDSIAGMLYRLCDNGMCHSTLWNKFKRIKNGTSCYERL